MSSPLRTSGPANPYNDPSLSPSVGVIEHQSLTQTVVSDPDGTLTPIGTTEEAIIVDPLTGARRALIRHHQVRDNHGLAITDARTAVLAWCAACGDRLLHPSAMRACAECRTFTCDRCRRPRHDAPDACCPACWRDTRLRRFFQWLLTINR